MIQHRNLLIYLLIAFNTAAGAASVWAYLNGYADAIFREASYVPHGMLALFLFGLISTFIRGFRASGLINEHKRNPVRDDEKARAAEKALIKQAHIGWMVDQLVFVSLVGTAIGIRLMLPEGGEGLQGTSPEGLRIALTATIMGFILALWTGANGQMLDTAIRCYLVDVRK